ncbi:SURF1 family protein [Iamia majanohamensis]|uniref:SURF1-like protein n=1 Tax=Iamia majanohamensis TaxID=467976 RepID=A0AAF0BTX6_9ACTN|nr:SURF1 family protein [Iamia majanohamensis]WCO65393.1 SURF1 family protein [Iamia majanohamensis]
MYRFALRPWWIVSHLFVLALVVTFVGLGLWQLDRLDERRDRNAELAARIDQPEVALAELVPEGDAAVSEDQVEDRRVTATGTYRPDEAVLVRGRSLRDSPGSWVLVPLELADGRVVAVNRGWIRNDGRYSAVPEEYAAVPAGEVTVTGLTHPSQERGTLGATDPTGTELTSLARVDLDRLDEQVDGELLPVWVQLTQPEAGAPDPSPEPLDPPVVDDEGPHLSYAFQWFTFAAIALGGYPLILRRVARERGRGGPDDAVGLDEPDPHDRPAPGDPRLDAPVEP